MNESLLFLLLLLLELQITQDLYEESSIAWGKDLELLRTLAVFLSPDTDVIRWAREHLLLRSISSLTNKTDMVLEGACIQGNVLLVALLLLNPKISFRGLDSVFLEITDMAIVRLLLADSRFNPDEPKHRYLRKACGTGHVDFVKQLLADERFTDPTSVLDAFCTACRAFPRMVQFLLTTPTLCLVTASPSSIQQCLLSACSCKGDVEIVRLLFSCKDFDTPQNAHFAFLAASRTNECDVAIMGYLMSEKHVDPSFHNQFALQQAFMERTRTHRCAVAKPPSARSQVLRLLFADERVDLLCDSHGDFPLLILLFLRQSFRDYVRRELNQLTKFHLDKSFWQKHSLLAEVPLIEKQILECLNVYLISDLSAICLAFLPDYLGFAAFLFEKYQVTRR
jgi:hypothetical protein